VIAPARRTTPARISTTGSHRAAVTPRKLSP
jgi:hypothetical protein